MAVNAVQTALTSRRFNRWLLVLGAVVLAAGIIAILATKVGGSGTSENANPTGPPIADVAKAQPNIPFPKAAWKVVRQFVFTALPRRNLAQSYALSDPTLKGGFTLGQWKSGNIPVTYFPTANVYKYNWKNTNFTHSREAALNLILIPTKGSGMRPGTFQIGLVKVGQGAKAHWLVDYFNIVAGPPVPTPK
jgi:hypothetical protein